jgi:ribose transport system ATP-binding protein
VNEVLLYAEGVVKRFGGVLALDGVSLEIRAGEVNALVGENGAGKSTLINILTGAYKPDAGTVHVGSTILPSHSNAARAAGIAAVLQHPEILPHLTVADNVVLGRWSSRLGFVSGRATEAAAREALNLVAPHLSPRMMAGRLSPADAHLVAIARAISEHSRILLLDEPTTSLSPPEVDRLLALIGRLRKIGLGVLFVSHILDDVKQLADQITVIRDGRLIGSWPASKLTADAIVRLMVGRDVAEQSPVARTLGAVVVDVRGLGRKGILTDVSINLRAGEIVSIMGLVGAGRSELIRALFGFDQYDTGEVYVAGKRLPKGRPIAAIRKGVGLVPEDRQRLALVPQRTLMENLTLSILDILSRLGFVSRRREIRVTEEQCATLQVKAASPYVNILALSGGNQQKVVIARSLARKPRVLILDEPTQGVDVGAKAEIHKIVVQLADTGVGVLLVSSDLPEVMLLSDRAYVMSKGRIVREFDRVQLDAEKAMKHAIFGTE